MVDQVVGQNHRARGTEHAAVDDFLQQARLCADLRQADSQMGTLAAMKKLNLSDRLSALGAINRHLLALIHRQEGGRLEYARVFTPHFDQVPQGKSRQILSSMSEGERLYRLFFLVALSLVAESAHQGKMCFQLQHDLVKHLEIEALPEME